MQKIVHCADLHLVAPPDPESRYSLSVLEEILSSASSSGAGHILFAGDTFDSFRDAEGLKGEFRKIAGRYPAIQLLLLPGNHESHGRGANSLSKLDLGPNVKILSSEPFGLENIGDAELLYVPHNESYGDYSAWAIPQKKQRYRLMAIHAVISGLGLYCGPECEPGEASFPADAFSVFGVDYAALGHIHGKMIRDTGFVKIVYPGSARVWRRNETGPRGFILITLDEGLRADFVELVSAGLYRAYTLAVPYDGSSPDISSIEREACSRDRVFIELRGIVNDEKKALEIESELTSKLSGKVRLLDPVSRDSIAVTADTSHSGIVARFLYEAAKKKDSVEPELYARILYDGLSELKKELDGR